MSKIMNLTPSLTTTSLAALPQIEKLNVPDVSDSTLDLEDTVETTQLKYMLPNPSSDVVRSPLTVDMRTEILGMSQVRNRHITVGRVWQAARSNIAYGMSSNWGTTKQTLMPLAGGAAAPMPDRNTAAAMAALPSLFIMTNASPDLGNVVRNHINRLASKDVNTMRMSWRLAQLWWGVSISTGDRGDATVGTDKSPAVLFIDTAGNWASMISEVAERDVIPYKVAYSHTQEIHCMQVLLLAASGRINYSARNMPTIITSAPPLRNPLLTIYGKQAQLGSSFRMTAATIWEVATGWCSAYGDLDSFYEAIDVIGALLVSHNGQAPITGHSMLRITLPESNMAALSLGPISQKYLEWQSTSIIKIMPDWQEVIAKGATAALMYGLALRHTAHQHGSYILYQTKGRPYKHMHIQDMWSNKAIIAPMFAAASRVYEGLQPGSKLGRMLKRVSFGSFNYDMAANWWNSHASALQWEESLPLVAKLPSACMLRGILSGIKVTSSPILNRYYRAGQLPDNLTPSEVMCGLQYVKGIEISQACYKADGISMDIENCNLRKSYRGVYSDWSIPEEFSTMTEKVMPVVRFTNLEGIAQAIYGNPSDIQVKWMYAKKEQTYSDHIFMHGDDGLNVPPGAADDVSVEGGVNRTGVGDDSDKPNGSGGIGQEDNTSDSGLEQLGTSEKGTSIKSENKLATTPRMARFAYGMEILSSVDKLDPPADSSLGRLIKVGRTLAESRCEGDYETISTDEGLRRQVFDAWVQTPIKNTLLGMEPGSRERFVKAMVAMGEGLASMELSNVEVMHRRVNLERWKATYASVADNALMTDDEIKEWISEETRKRGKAPDLDTLTVALSQTDLETSLATGGSRVKDTYALYQDVVRAGGMAGVDSKAAKAVLERRAKANAAAAEAHEAMIQEHEGQIKESYDLGIIPADVVIDVLGYKPKWISEAETAEVPIVDTPDVILHDSELNNHIKVEGTTLAEIQQSAEKEISEIHGRTGKEDFGNASSSEHVASGGTPQNAGVMKQEEAQNVMAVGVLEVKAMNEI